MDTGIANAAWKVWKVWKVYAVCIEQEGREALVTNGKMRMNCIENHVAHPDIGGHCPAIRYATSFHQRDSRRRHRNLQGNSTDITAEGVHMYILIG